MVDYFNLQKLCFLSNCQNIREVLLKALQVLMTDFSKCLFAFASSYVSATCTIASSKASKAAYISDLGTTDVTSDEELPTKRPRHSSISEQRLCQKMIEFLLKPISMPTFLI